MSIKHLEDLSPTTLRQVWKSPWRVVEKFDGSFLIFGLDSDNRFFTQLKGGQRFYNLDEWSTEGWAVGFRQAHLVLENYTLYRQHNGSISASTQYGVEVMYGYQPNTIVYPHGDQITIVSYPDPEVYKMNYSRFSTVVSIDQTYTCDGISRENKKIQARWKVRYPMITHNCEVDKLAKASTIMRWLEVWLDHPSTITELTNCEFIELNLVSRPEKISVNRWKEIKPNLKSSRDQVRISYRNRVREIKKAILGDTEFMYGCETHIIEGYVISTPGIIFKLVDQDIFLKMNSFTHRIRDGLLGDKRKRKPGFMGRTKAWPVEKRLKRLETLRTRYLAHHMNIKRKFIASGYRNVNLSYTGDLHQRMLFLFLDIKERLENGR
jgi:hypothetical protein